MDSSLEERFAPKLQYGERILWTGRPASGITFQREMVFYWGSCAGLILWAIFTELLFNGDAGPIWLKSFAEWSHADIRAAVFAVAGLMLILVPPLLEFTRKPRISYAVTSSRLLIFFEYGRPTLRGWIIEATPILDLTEGANGRGTIRFGKPGSTASSEVRMSTSALLFAATRALRMGLSLFDKQGVPGFADIPDARRVYEMVAAIRGND